MDVIAQTVETYDRIAAEYCKKTRQPNLLQCEENFIKRLLSHIDEPTPLVLDVGCADGRHCVMIDRNGGRAIGIDLSTAMLIEAKSYHPIGSFSRMDMRNLAFTDDFIDGMWVSGCIYHVPKVEAKSLVEEFARALKLDGVVAVNFKLGEGEGLEQNPRSYAGFPRYFAYYSKEEMKKLFEGHGFQELETCEFPEEIFGDRIQQMWLRLKSK